MTNQNNNQGDRPTELEKLIKEARGRCDHHYSQCGGECTNGVVRMINEAYKLGALAAIEATKKIDYVYERGLICPKCREVYPEGSFKNFNIFCKRGCGEPVMSPIVYAEHQLQEFSDAFLNSLNSNQQRDE